MKFKEVMARAMRPSDGAPQALSVGAASDDGEVDLVLYDQIGFWGVSSDEFARVIGGIDAKVIHLRIDCPGGDVFMARAMKVALEQHPARVVAHVDGLAASAASYLMLGADEIEMARGAFVMIHNAWTITVGDTHDHADEASLLDKIDASIRDDYAAKTGKPADDFRPLMDAETWLDADEALELGLIDRIYDKDGGVENRFDLSLFENAPAALALPKHENSDTARRAEQMRRLRKLDALAP